MQNKKKLGLPAWIAIAMVAGIAVGAIMWAIMGAEAADAFASSYIKPFGNIFIRRMSSPKKASRWKLPRRRDAI